MKKFYSPTGHKTMREFKAHKRAQVKELVKLCEELYVGWYLMPRKTANLQTALFEAAIELQDTLSVKKWGR